METGMETEVALEAQTPSRAAKSPAVLGALW